jgi:hypothetical protein
MQVLNQQVTPVKRSHQSTHLLQRLRVRLATLEMTDAAQGVAHLIDGAERVGGGLLHVGFWTIFSSLDSQSKPLPSPVALAL